MKTEARPKIEKLSAAKQRSLDKLLEKNSEGTISPKERATLEKLVAEAERLMVANGRRVAKFAEASKSNRGSAAVPVTVWIQSKPARR